MFIAFALIKRVSTGPLLPEDLDVEVIPFEQGRKLSVNLCGKDMSFVSDIGKYHGE